MKRWEILNRLIAQLGLRRYLEIGIGRGSCFQRIRCSHKIGVDPEPLGEMCDHPLVVRKSSDEFFADYVGPRFDLVFIDGLHCADQVHRDIENALRLLSARGIIVCHDMNPTAEAQQMVPRVQSQWTGDGWKALCSIRQQRPELDVFTLDTDYGCAVICPRRPKLPRFQSPDLTWEFLEAHRVELLNLRPPEYLDVWLKTCQ